MYRDRGLDELLPQVEISNQTVAAAAAAYEEAKRRHPAGPGARCFRPRPRNTPSRAPAPDRPPIGSGISERQQCRRGGRRQCRYSTQYTAPINGSWDIDVWGSIRRQIESNTAAAQASAADLDNAKLSAQATLATAYFNLRAADSLRDLLDRTVAQFKETLRVTRE